MTRLVTELNAEEYMNFPRHAGLRSPDLEYALEQAVETVEKTGEPVQVWALLMTVEP